MEKVSSTFLRFAKPLYDPETAGFALDSLAAKGALELCSLVWNATVKADNEGDPSWLKQLEETAAQDPQLAAAVSHLISWKRSAFREYPWLVGACGFRENKDGESVFFATAHSGTVKPEQIKSMLPTRESDTGLATVFLSFAEPMIGAFGNPSPRTNAFDAALALSHAVWNAATTDQGLGNADRVQFLIEDNKEHPQLVALIVMMDERKRAQFAEHKSILGTYDYTPTKDGSISLWVNTHTAHLSC